MVLQKDSANLHNRMYRPHPGSYHAPRFFLVDLLECRQNDADGVPRELRWMVK